MSGHVFVVRGDLRKLGCDAWLTPCDVGAYPLRRWLEWPPDEPAVGARHPDPPKGWGRGGVRSFKLEQWPAHLPQPWLTNIGGSPKGGTAWFVQGAVQFLERAAADLAGSPPRHRRARHLLALPVVGTGFGGARRMAGEVVRELLPALYDAAARLEVDVALVAIEGPTYAAAQAERARLNPDWSELGEELREAGEKLARIAARGDLVLFLGAGVSVNAGLPGWNDLLDALAQQAGMSAPERADLARLDPLDRAHIVERRFGGAKALGDAIFHRHLVWHPSLAHQLLAALPVREAVTTNYDCLFELASEAAGRSVSVLPYAIERDADRWLLKMHGCVSCIEDIVLTREDYLRYENRRTALSGIVQALLITRHMLFVGFSLSDDNFHRIADAVRRALEPVARRGADRRFGTTLVLSPEPLLAELW